MKYNAYEFILRQHNNGRYSVHWGIRDPNARCYGHRVGGPAYVHYSSEGRVFALAWDLEGREYPTGAEYWKALEEWLG